ncbi:MAG: hypothetical protein Unbinned4311contig1001_5 [Prokaryotic dsDNA virus sp.]|nr:MAG: hypothetical protein Unbinned4311contig1001_5 [Prokaryotic dsDNA virus sp.]|tara:strand:+ start:1281 stop:2381 length:1101 start_codon:yes stop_codon:yes gene_type:complete
MKNIKKTNNDGYQVLQNPLILDVIDNCKGLTENEKDKLKEIKLTIRKQRRGYGGWSWVGNVRRHYITIPLWVLENPKNARSQENMTDAEAERYFEYYVLHELAHVLQHFDNPNDSGHSELFYSHFTRICPEEIQHFESGYKPRLAAAAGVPKKSEEKADELEAIMKLEPKKLTKLGDRNYTLLATGAKTTGDYVEGFYMVEEQMYIDEADHVLEYCKWLKDNDKGMGWGNYEERFAEFLKSSESVSDKIDREVEEDLAKMKKAETNIAKYKSPATAAKKFAEGLRAFGFEDAVAIDPKRCAECGYGNSWAVICEDAPYEAMVWLSMGESMYTEPWTSNGKPEFKLLGADNWYTEPYNSYVLCFVKD